MINHLEILIHQAQTARMLQRLTLLIKLSMIMSTISLLKVRPWFVVSSREKKLKPKTLETLIYCSEQLESSITDIHITFFWKVAMWKILTFKSSKTFFIRLQLEMLRKRIRFSISILVSCLPDKFSRLKLLHRRKSTRNLSYLTEIENPSRHF